MAHQALFLLLALVVVVVILWLLGREYGSEAAPDSSAPKPGKPAPIRGVPVRTLLFVLAGICALIYMATALRLHWKIAENKTAYTELFMQNGTGRLLRPAAETAHWHQGSTYALFRSITLLPNGALEFRLTLPYPGRIYVIPRPTGSSGHLRWDCVTTDSPWLRSFLLDCGHDPTFDPALPILVDLDAIHVMYFEFNRSDEEGLGEEGIVQFKRFIASLAEPWIRQVLQVEISAYSDPVGSLKNNLRIANARAAFVHDAFLHAEYRAS